MKATRRASRALRRVIVDRGGGVVGGIGALGVVGDGVSRFFGRRFGGVEEHGAALADARGVHGDAVSDDVVAPASAKIRLRCARGVELGLQRGVERGVIAEHAALLIDADVVLSAVGTQAQRDGFEVDALDRRRSWVYHQVLGRI